MLTILQEQTFFFLTLIFRKIKINIAKKILKGIMLKGNIKRV